MPTSIRSKRPIRLYIRERREERGLTQQQVADRIGTSKDQISRWENSKRGVKIEVLAAIADALGYEDITPLLRPPGTPSVDELLRRLSPEAQTQAVEIVQTFVRRTGTGG